MQVADKDNTVLHKKLPIDDDENIIAIYRHHWFAYAINWITGIFIVIVIMTLAIALTSIGGADSSMAGHRSQIIALAGAFSMFVLLGTMLPVYLRSQEQLVLTDESLLQVLQPSLFASKVDSLSLQRIDDVSVRQDFLGTIFGYGHMTVETPGEQDNYEFTILPAPHKAAREISSTKEDFEAALNAGRLPSSMGSDPLPQAPQIDPQQFQQFLQYQQMVAQQQSVQQSNPSDQLQSNTVLSQTAVDEPTTQNGTVSKSEESSASERTNQ